MVTMNYIEVVIYVYFIVGILFVLWNIRTIGKDKIQKKINHKKKILYKMTIKEELANFNKRKYLSEKHETFLKNKLKNANNLLIFEDVLTKLKQEKNSKIEEYCIAAANTFQYLTTYYREKDSIQKAYFTHVLSEFPELMQNDDNSINYAMMHFVFDKSIYCRENAMLFFYHKGSVSQVVNSLKKISNRNLYYSPKLISDNLLEFTGDVYELSSALLSEFDSFSVNFQLAIMNYIRLKREDRCGEIYQKLKSHKYNKEVELAMVRYFGTYKYEPAKEILIEMMNDKHAYNYEYRLVAAYALAMYDEKEVRKILIENLKDLNWFVRKNTALSLSRMSLTKEEHQTIKNLDDKYAKEMMQYIWEDTKEKQKKERSKSNE